MQSSTKAWLYCVAALVPLTAAAQTAAAGANPADPAARVPPVKYESAFAGYTPYRDAKVAPWRDVNDEVARVGGHIGIMRDAARGTAAGPAREKKR